MNLMSRLPVRISTLKDGVTLGFSLYLQLPHKIIKYIDEQDAIEQDQIKSLKGKKVRKLYIEDQDEPKYQEYMDRCLNDVLNDETIGTEQKAQVVVGASEANAERIMADPKSQQSYVTAQNTSQKLIEVLSSNDELLRGIFDHKAEDGMADKDALMHKHAVNTSSLCISFGEFLKLEKEVIHNLGVAGLFHDVAYGQLSEAVQQLFFIPMDQMDAEQLSAYKEHPRLAGEYLQDKDFASKDVIDLILVHEERQGANGFPNKLGKLELVQEVIALCAYYDQQVTCFNQERASVLKELAISQLGNFELTTINKFKEFLTKAGLS